MMRGRSLLLMLLVFAVLGGAWLSLPRSGVVLGAGKGVGKNGVEGSVFPGNEGADRRGVDGVVARDFRGNQVSVNEGMVETQAVRDRLREMQRTDDEGLEVVTMADGHQSIDLKGRFQHVTRLVAGEDGKLVPACGGYLTREVSGE